MAVNPTVPAELSKDGHTAASESPNGTESEHVEEYAEDGDEPIAPLEKPSARAVAFAVMGAAVILVAILAALQIFGGSAPTGASSDQVRGLKNLNGCALKPGTQCARVDLRFNLRASQLSGSDFRQAVLTNLDMSGSDLSQANLRQALMGQINLSQADLTGANMRQANLQSANLTQSIMVGSDLTGANLNGAQLLNADLTNAKLARANVNGARLNNALLNGVDFSGSDLSNSDLTGADITGATFSGAKVEGCKGCGQP